MPRIGKAPIVLPEGTEVDFAGGLPIVKGLLGTLTQPIHSLVKVTTGNGTTTFASVDESCEADALQGMMCTLAASTVKGMMTGFEHKLNPVGVGYRASVQDTALKLQLGFLHDMIHEISDGVKAEMSTQAEIIIKGSGKQKAGQVAVEVRGYRPSESCKGKGVRYADERVALKETRKK